MRETVGPNLDVKVTDLLFISRLFELYEKSESEKSRQF